MKLSSIYPILILPVICFFSCNSKDPVNKATGQQINETPIQEILTLEKLRWEAVAQFDSLKFKQLLAPDFELTTAQGEVLKAKQILQILQKKSQFSISEHHFTRSTKIQFLNDHNLAIAKGVYVCEKKENRGLIVLTFRYTDVYIRNSSNKTWMLASSHQSRIAR